MITQTRLKTDSTPVGDPFMQSPQEASQSIIAFTLFAPLHHISFVQITLPIPRVSIWEVTVRFQLRKEVFCASFEGPKDDMDRLVAIAKCYAGLKRKEKFNKKVFAKQLANILGKIPENLDADSLFFMGEQLSERAYLDEMCADEEALSREFPNEYDFFSDD